MGSENQTYVHAVSGKCHKTLQTVLRQCFIRILTCEEAVLWGDWFSSSRERTKERILFNCIYLEKHNICTV